MAEAALREDLTLARARLEVLESTVIQQLMQQTPDESPLVQLLDSTKEVLRFAQSEVSDLKADKLLLEEKISAGMLEQLRMKANVDELQASIKSVTKESQLRQNKLEEMTGAYRSLQAEKEQLQADLLSKDQLMAVLENELAATKSAGLSTEESRVRIDGDLSKLRIDLETEKAKAQQLIAENEVSSALIDSSTHFLLIWLCE